jgi:hypothetical protein
MCDLNYLKVTDEYCQVLGNPERSSYLWREFWTFVQAMPEMALIARRDDKLSYEYILFFETIGIEEVRQRFRDWEKSLGILRDAWGYIHHV